MSDWEIKSLQNQLEHLEKRINKESKINFIWLMVLSNVLFALFIAYINLKIDFTNQSKHQEILKTHKN